MGKLQTLTLEFRHWNSKFRSLILLELTTCQNNFTLPIAKALDRGLLERNGRKLDMERKVQRSSWFLTVTRFCLQDSKPHVYVHKKNDIHQLNKYSKCDCMTGCTQRNLKNKRHFSAGTLTGDQGWQFHSGTVLFFLCKTPSHWKPVGDEAESWGPDLEDSAPQNLLKELVKEVCRLNDTCWSCVNLQPFRPFRNGRGCLGNHFREISWWDGKSFCLTFLQRWNSYFSSL